MIQDCIILFADLFLYGKKAITAFALRDFIKYHPSSYVELPMRDLESALARMKRDGKLKPITSDEDCKVYVKTETYTSTNRDIVLQRMFKHES